MDFGQGKKPYEIMTLYNKTPFSCKKKENKVICFFNKKPSTPVYPENTYFFRVIPQKGKIFKIVIIVKSSYKLYSMPDNLYNAPLISPFKLSKAKKWVIIANSNFVKNTQKGLNFYYKHTFYPFVGAVDENLNPVKVSKSADVIAYFQILKEYEKGQDALYDINNFIKQFPNSIFIPDVLYLKLKILDAQNDSPTVVDIGKKWIKKYAFSPKLPAVLLLIAKNYSKMGFVSDASYYFNRIITEYPNTKYAQLAMIYLADQLYMLGEEKKAFKLYKKVLYSTTDINIASLAALRLATRYMNNGNVKKAIEYYEKIYRANKQFLLKDKQKAYELAQSLASHGAYKLAIQIGEDLLKKLNKLNDLYEPLLYNLAQWAYEAKEYKKALKFADLYLKQFPYGEYSDEVTSLRDKILFQVPEGNLTAQLEDINKILKNYSGEIAQKALVKKAEILYKLKKFSELMKIFPKLKKLPKSVFPNKDEFLNKVKKDYAIYLLSRGKCYEASELIEKYSIVLPKKYDDKIYECAMKSAHYKLASLICNKYLDSPDDKVFLKWIKRKINALYAMGDYQGVVTAVDDLCSATKKGCYPYLLKKFFSLWRLKEYKKAIALSLKLQKYKDIRNTDAFIKIVDYALTHNDKLLAASYAKKIIELQNYFKAYPYTPYADFVFAQYTKDKKAAVKDLLRILPMLKGENKARAYFMLANLTNEKKYLLQCLKVKNSKLWKGLCKDALTLY